MSSVTEPIAAGSWKEFFEPGDFFRLLGTTGPVTVEFYYLGRKTVDLKDIEAGYAEYFRAQGQLPFDRVRIYSATTQTVQFVTRSGSDVRYDRGASSVTGTIALDAATLAALEQISVRPEAPSGSYKNNAAIVANTPELVFTAAANINGAILLEAGINVYGAGVAPIAGFVAKATAPATPLDGDPVFVEGMTTNTSGAGNTAAGKLQILQNIPAGVGLFFISDTPTAGANGSSWRHCRYKLL